MQVVGYCRFSSDNQRHESIEAQERAIKEFCRLKGFLLTKLYIDEAMSGTSDDRPQFLKMIEDSYNRNFEGIVVHKLDRFARNRYDSAVYKKKLKDNGVSLFSVLENLDNSPESILLESLLEGLNEYYSKNLAREVMKGLKENAYKGLHNGGTPPLGYDVKDRKYIINPIEAETVKMIFKLYLSGVGYANIANELNSIGKKSKAGKDFTKGSIREILLNEKYTGVYVYNKRKSKKENHIYKNSEQIIKLEGAVPQIISKEDYEEVQARLDSKKRGPRKNVKRFYLVTGKMTCELCGSSYSGNGYVNGRGGKKYVVYSCVGRTKNKSCTNKSIRQNIIEDFVIDELKKNIFTDQSIKKICDNILELHNKKALDSYKDIKVLKNKENDLSRKINKLIDCFLEDDMDKEFLNKKMTDLKAEINDIRLKIFNIENTSTRVLKEEDIRAFIEVARDNLESQNPELIQTVVSTFVEEIIIGPENVQVVFRINKNLDSGKANGDEPLHTFPLSAKRVDLYGMTSILA